MWAVSPEGLKREEREAGGGLSATPASANRRPRATGRATGVIRPPRSRGPARPAAAPRPADGAYPRMGLPGRAWLPLAYWSAAPSGWSAAPAPAGRPRPERNPAAGGAPHPADGGRQGWPTPTEVARRLGEVALSPRTRRTDGNFRGRTGWGCSTRRKYWSIRGVSQTGWPCPVVGHAKGASVKGAINNSTITDRQFRQIDGASQRNG